MARSLLFALLIVAAAAPVSAQVSFVGDWAGRYHEDQPDRVPGEEPGDFSGIPLNDAARRFGDAWDVARHSVIEHQCAPYTLPYMFFGPNQFRIWEERHPDTQELIALQMYMGTYQQRRTIWLDGRPHPPEYAPQYAPPTADDAHRKVKLVRAGVAIALLLLGFFKSRDRDHH